MTIRNLDCLFKPRAIAMVSRGNYKEGSDARLLRNLITGGFQGPIMPVNPDRRSLYGVLCYRDVASLPVTPDLALVLTPLPEAPALVSALGERGARAVVLLQQGQGPLNEGLRQAILDAAKPFLLRVLGPDPLGLVAPHQALDASLGAVEITPGPVSLISQSGAVMRVVMDWAAPRGIGFSHLVSLGASVDVDVGDMLDYLARDTNARAMLIYFERIHNGRKFMSAARAAARIKPIIALKPASDPSNRRQDACLEAAFRRAGILRVSTIVELFNAVETLSTVRPVVDNRLAIVSNSHSLGLIASDWLAKLKGRLAPLPMGLATELEEVTTGEGELQNPLDLGDFASPEAYKISVTELLQAPHIDAVLVLHAPFDPTLSEACAQAVVEAFKAVRGAGQANRRPLLTGWVGGEAAHRGRQCFAKAQIPTFETPEEAVNAFNHVHRYQRTRELLMETPPSIPSRFKSDVEGAAGIVQGALDGGRRQLSLLEAKDLLTSFAIDFIDTRFAATPHEVAEHAKDLGGSVAIKILSDDIPHKSAVGGVVFGLEGAQEALTSAETMAQRVAQLAPEATLKGFVVQPMQMRGGAFEVAMGITMDHRFGPVVWFGFGGTEAAVVDDTAYALPPLNLQLARDLMARTRLYSLLEQLPGRRVDMDALALTLIKVSQMAVDLVALDSLEINPLWASADGVVALDARVQLVAVDPATGRSPQRRLAICPYPSEWERPMDLNDGRELLLRPILPEDEPALQDMVRRMPAEDRRLRFFQPIRELPHAMAARLTQLDYDREMAFVLADPDAPPGRATLWGVVRLAADPDLEKAEYAIIVDRAMGGQGLGKRLMNYLIDYAKGRGIGELYGEVLRENERMLRLNRALGFKVARDPDDPDMYRVTLPL